jgi:hypothetical protein
MGCGTFGALHARFAKATPGLSAVVKAARKALHASPKFKQACLEAKAVLQDRGQTEGVPVAVDTARRLIASMFMEKAAMRGADGAGMAETIKAAAMRKFGTMG